MRPSEISLLRKELVKVTTEYRNLQKKMAELETSLTKRITLLEMENDRLSRELAERDRKMEKYENSDAPSSTDSLYNAERTAFRKRVEREDADGQQDGPEPEDEDKTRRGPLAGHAGIKIEGSNKWKTMIQTAARLRLPSNPFLFSSH